MRPRAYIETTIVSYLTAFPIEDIVHGAHKQITREWWARRDRFDLFISDAVLSEARRGNRAAADRRIVALHAIPVLVLDAVASDLANRFMRVGALPEKAATDAVHIAVAVVNGMDYLLTWNCKHIANAAIRGKIEYACGELGLVPTIICTPEELTEA
jgi:predicted nucleic acid-binding protein